MQIAIMLKDMVLFATIVTFNSIFTLITKASLDISSTKMVIVMIQNMDAGMAIKETSLTILNKKKIMKMSKKMIHNHQWMNTSHAIMGKMNTHLTGHLVIMNAHHRKDQSTQIFLMITQPLIDRIASITRLISHGTVLIHLLEIMSSLGFHSIVTTTIISIQVNSNHSIKSLMMVQ